MSSTVQLPSAPDLPSPTPDLPLLSSEHHRCPFSPLATQFRCRTLLRSRLTGRNPIACPDLGAPLPTVAACTSSIAGFPVPRAHSPHHRAKPVRRRPTPRPLSRDPAVLNLSPTNPSAAQIPTAVMNRATLSTASSSDPLDRCMLVKMLCDRSIPARSFAKEAGNAPPALNFVYETLILEQFGQRNHHQRRWNLVPTAAVGGATPAKGQ